jgi:UPF0755 protein
MSRRKNRHSIGIFLLLLLIGIGLLILWLGIPQVVEKTFGAASTTLTPFQQRQYGLRLLLAKDQFGKPNPDNNSEIPFVIQEGSSISQIASTLESTGLVKNGPRFRDYLIYKGIDSKIRSGNFMIPNTFSLIEIAEMIRSDNPIVSFYIYPGWRAEEVAAGLKASGVQISTEDFMRVVNNPSGIQQPAGLSTLSSLEGFLYPGEYQIRKDSSAEELIQLFVTRFQFEVLAQVETYSAVSGMSITEIVTLASIIQRESLVKSELPTIASVFYNRLDTGMKLETDPTVQYAIGYDENSQSWWKTPLYLDDLGFQSVFNTYMNYGLPPHAISNPGIESIMAVIQPENTSYFYFQANCDGSGTHVFSMTFEEHISHNCK